MSKKEQSKKEQNKKGEDPEKKEKEEEKKPKKEIDPEEPRRRAIIQSFQRTIPANKTQTCCLLKNPSKKSVESKMIEEDIYEFYKKRLLTVTDRDLYGPKKPCKCKRFEPFTTCVNTVRTIQEQKQHAVARENYLRTKWILEHPSHDHKPKVKKAREVIELEPPKGGEKVPLKLASPSCSRETFYKPTRKLIDLKKPKSGIFINPKKVKDKGLELPFQDYNARIIQNHLDTGHCGLYNLDQDNEGNYIWVNDTNKPKEEAKGYKRACLKECINFKPKYYAIPDDLYSSFGPSSHVIQGTSVVMPLDSVQDYRRPKEIACLYFAFSQVFATSKEWDPALIDYILDKGDELHQQSLAIDYKNRTVDFDIIPEITEAACTLEIYLHFSGLLTGNPNLFKVLALFFDRYNAAIFCCEDMYLLIWKHSQDTFKVFDPNGREKDGCSSASGRATLITTNPIEHLVHLILNLSSLSPLSTYVLYEIKLVNFGHIPTPIDKSKPPRKAKKLYQVVNKYFALIPGASGILNPLSKDETNSSLMIAYITIAYIELDPPIYWTVNIVDNLIKYGTMRYKDFIFERQISKCTIGHLPRDLVFGSYRAGITVKPFQYMGGIGSLSGALEDFFKDNSAGILEVDASAFAIWRDSNFYYVLDPFKRGKLCAANKDPNEGGIGYLQLHINLDSLTKTMVKNANTFATSGKFFIHGVKVDSVTVFNANRQLLLGNNFDSLYIVYPFPCPFPPPKYLNCDVLKSAESLPQLECLSILSESPCERVCSESDFLAREKKAKRNQMIVESLKKSQSIQSVPETAETSYFSNREVVESLLALILNDVMGELEDVDKRKKKTGKRKTVKPTEETTDQGAGGTTEGGAKETGKDSKKAEGTDKKQTSETKSERELAKLQKAERILVHTDEGYLKELKKKYERGQLTDDTCKTFQSFYVREKPLTLEEELKLESNFSDIPDGSWIILSTIEVEVGDENYTSGILSAIVSIALSSIFKISTWSSEVLDYIFASAEIFAEDFEPHKYIVSTLLQRPLPMIRLGEQQYTIEITKKADGDVSKFDGTVSQELQMTDKLLVIFNRFACAIFKRYNFYYLFVGFPSDLVGFRTNLPTGHLCLTRYTDYDTMMKRVDFGRMNAGDADAFIICHIHTSDVTAYKLPFLERTQSNEDQAIKIEMENQEEYKKLREERLKLITKEIKREKKRIENFKKDKRRVEKEREQRSERKDERRRLREERAQKRIEKMQRLAEEKERREQEELEREEREDRERMEAEERKRQKAEERKKKEEERKQKEEERRLKEEERRKQEEEERERKKNEPPPPEEPKDDEAPPEGEPPAEGEKPAGEETAPAEETDARKTGGDDTKKGEEAKPGEETKTGDEANKDETKEGEDTDLGKPKKRKKKKMVKKQKENGEEEEVEEEVSEEEVVEEEHKEEEPKPGEEEEIEEEEEKGEEEEVEPKHVPGKHLSTLALGELYIKPTVFGYRFTEPECLFKIQGSTAIEDRSTAFSNKIKDCQLACVFAILSAVLKPLRLWDSFRIDHCIEKGKHLGKRIKNKTMVKERIIRNIIVDDFTFSVIVSISDMNIIPKANIDSYIKRILRTRKYFMIQISNCTFAVYKDEFFHLFDPYKTLEKGSSEEGEDMEEMGEEGAGCDEKIPFPKYEDRNTASWILFAEIDDMFKYIKKRAANEKWTEKFKLLVVDIMKYAKANKDVQRAHALDKKYVSKKDEPIVYEDILCLVPENTDWLNIYPKQIAWSRLIDINSAGVPRDSAYDKEFDTEIPGRLWSLWGHIHPTNLMFGKLSGKQFLAVNVIAICMINTYRFSEWNRQIIDNIVFHGDKYFKESIKDIKKKEYEMTLEDLGVSYDMEYINYQIHIESVAYGRLYNRKKLELNLSASLGYFFSYFKDGVIQCNGRTFAFGKTSIGYYMFDCQAFGLPLFPHGQGSAYILRSSTLQQLLHCMVLTFNLPFYNMDFMIHKVELTVQKVEEEKEEDEQEKEQPPPEEPEEGQAEDEGAEKPAEEAEEPKK
ncbi:hypothetical protein ACFFRR_010755 [Megaselia abdita]